MIRIPQPKTEPPAPPPAGAPDDEARPTADPSDNVSAGSASVTVEPGAAQLEGSPLREGSPFAEGSESPPSASAVPHSQESPASGSLQYTAVGALVSSGVVLGFAVAAVLWFPLGAMAITGWGALLAMFGLRSGRIKTALLLVAVQLALFSSVLLKL